jgi:hypothetical protein
MKPVSSEGALPKFRNTKEFIFGNSCIRISKRRVSVERKGELKTSPVFLFLISINLCKEQNVLFGTAN